MHFNSPKLRPVSEMVISRSNRYLGKRLKAALPYPEHPAASWDVFFAKLV
jgi:hypothetical protein